MATKIARSLKEDFYIDEEENESEDFDFEEESYSPKQDSHLKNFAKNFQVDAKTIAKRYIEQFFKDKSLHCGGKIPKSLLFSDKRVSTVLNYDIASSVDRAYQALEPYVKLEEKKYGKLEVSCDIKLVTEILNLLSRSCVPQQFAGGILLLYLEFIEGIDIGPH